MMKNAFLYHEVRDWVRADLNKRAALLFRATRQDFQSVWPSNKGTVTRDRAGIRIFVLHHNFFLGSDNGEETRHAVRISMHRNRPTVYEVEETTSASDAIRILEMLTFILTCRKISKA